MLGRNCLAHGNAWGSLAGGKKKRGPFRKNLASRPGFKRAGNTHRNHRRRRALEEQVDSRPQWLNPAVAGTRAFREKQDTAAGFQEMQDRFQALGGNALVIDGIAVERLPGRIANAPRWFWSRATKV